MAAKIVTNKMCEGFDQHHVEGRRTTAGPGSFIVTAEDLQEAALRLAGLGSGLGLV